MRVQLFRAVNSQKGRGGDFEAAKKRIYLARCCFLDL
jgi:hypothetical protein